MVALCKRKMVDLYPVQILVWRKSFFWPNICRCQNLNLYNVEMEEIHHTQKKLMS
jgi:hypothetical protein